MIIEGGNSVSSYLGDERAELICSVVCHKLHRPVLFSCSYFYGSVVPISNNLSSSNSFGVSNSESLLFVY